MTLRDNCYLKHMHSSSSRQRDGERGNREGWSGEMERWRSTRLTTSFPLLCSCIMHGSAVHISRAFWTWCAVYIHAQDGTFSLQSTCTIWSRWVCVSVRIMHHLPNVVGGSLEQEAREKEWAREVMEAYRRDVKEVKRKVKLFYMWETWRQERASAGHRHTRIYSTKMPGH